jgi:hypothetical protein
VQKDFPGLYQDGYQAGSFPPEPPAFSSGGTNRDNGEKGIIMGEKDGSYCSICGGIPPDQIKIKKIPIEGKETGIDRLDWILQDVAGLRLTNDEVITDELVKRVLQFNYIPTRKMPEYREALLRQYKMLDLNG